MSLHEVPPSVLISSTIPSNHVPLKSVSKHYRCSKDMVNVPVPTCRTGEIRDSSDATFESHPAQRCSRGVICRRCQLTVSGRDCGVPAIVHVLLFASTSSLAEALGISSV